MTKDQAEIYAKQRKTTKKNLLHKRFGRMEIICESGNNKYGRAVWLCRCDCGNLTRIDSRSLLSGNTKSCGCLHKETIKEIFTETRKNQFGINSPNYRHGGSGTRLYNIWNAMKSRCYDVNFPNYKYYGKKGIKICDEWRNSFIVFHDWAIENGYSDNLTIDRIVHSGNYTPTNCQWITSNENASKAQKNRWERHREKYGCLHSRTVALNEEGNAGIYCVACGKQLQKEC